MLNMEGLDSVLDCFGSGLMDLEKNGSRSWDFGGYCIYLSLKRWNPR